MHDDLLIDVWNWTWWNDSEDTMLYWEAGSCPSHHQGTCKAFGAWQVHFCCFCELWVVVKFRKFGYVNNNTNGIVDYVFYILFPDEF